MITVNKHGRGSRYYGQLMTASLPSEVKSLWYSRDDELPELPQHKWSWELQDDMEQVERRELLTKILTDAPLSDRKALVIELVVIEELTYREIGLRLGVTQERVRQLYLQAMRRLRRHQRDITGIPAYELDCEVMSWSQWKWSKRCM
jgi:RNA polymerase sigma factor (sigma-70 family)